MPLGNTHFTLFLTVFFSLYIVIQKYKVTHLIASITNTILQLYLTQMTVPFTKI